MEEGILNQTIETAHQIRNATYGGQVTAPAYQLATAVVELDKRLTATYTALLWEVRIQRYPVESSNIASIGWHEVAEVLEVEFTNGSVYRYGHLPRNVYDALMAAESKGKFFAAQVRKCFKATMITPKREVPNV